MKKFWGVFIFALFVSGALSAQISGGGTAWVSSRSAAVKSSTWFFAGTRGTLPMGSQVSVVQVKGNWAEIRASGASSLNGWTQVGNLSSRRIVASGSGVSASEVALAGKGFNQEVENAYKAGGDLNYADVDKTEAIAVSQDELYQFVTEGRLVTGE